MVQEWQEAYMAYNYLKTILKDILHFRQRNASSPNIARTPKGSLKLRLSLYRAFSWLTSRCNNLRLSPKKNNEDEVILVSAVQEEGSPEGNYYETMFLMSSDEGEEYELVFFWRLDNEFNKVIKFYREKVEELIKEAEELNKKMDALIALWIKVDKPVIVSTTSQEINGNIIAGFRPTSLEVLNRVKINIAPETPVSTLKNIIMSSKSDFSFSKQELGKVEEKMRQAFIEFHQKLRLLKSYCFLNQLAFSKIMKKYDKLHFFYSLFGYIVLHMIMYAGNTYFRKRFWINYPFLFGFKLGTELGYREVLLLGSGLAILTLAGVISNLDMDMDPRTRSFRTITELVPLGLVTFTLPNFFLADQFTSQVQALRSLEFYICYYGWEDFKRRSNKCNQSDTFKNFCIVVSVIPYWLRSLQCLRRLFEEGNYMHALNTLKYFSTTVAIVMRTGNDQKWGKIWKIMAGSSSAVATLASTYWDIVIDWGLLRRNSRNLWLRDKLLISNKSVYFVAIVLDVMLRLAWMQSVLGFYEAPFLHRTAVIAIVACLEIICRGI
ncbi:hypothetical protein LOK49_LG01G03739 [Camellia lanceoleosa]|uniref:Uncharacterized protein n=1 Tax=Camellia lanceoleosa TaxID=1840588 RepID=A0ACC0J4G1_9ERIC|nr:hypothetical protein LOK49_LG01G03739 [Camellia lanceoleosa]